MGAPPLPPVERKPNESLEGGSRASAISALLERIAKLEQQVAELRERALKQGGGPLEPM
jgi:uncharacterized protein YceH (UPF0502 family)